MPFYCFYCPYCQKEKEIQLPMSQAGEKAKCPDCGKAMKRVYNFNTLSSKTKQKNLSCPTGSCPFVS